MFVVAVVAVAVAAVAGGRSPAQLGGFFAKGKGSDYFGLVQNPQVREELKLTDAQVEKLPAAAWKALGEVLDAKQLKRLREIYLQQRGNSAFLEADVKKELKITEAQVKQIQAALDKQAADQKAMFESGGFDFEKLQEIQKTTTAAVQGVLNAEQKTAWTKMIGEPFQLKGFGKGKKGGGD
jgi:hypothetical protein